MESHPSFHRLLESLRGEVQRSRRLLADAEAGVEAAPVRGREQERQVVQSNSNCMVS
jgi:hypothetical protein